MTHGYVSDINGDDTVMESPEATLRIDLSELPPQQAFRLAQLATTTQDSWVMGELLDGNASVQDELNDAEFHLPIEAAITALIELDVIEGAETETDIETIEDN